ncbi:uncharacterized protein LOC111674785 [Lucilia cuprina]|uniref:uncharacterized protein LOC111674785 n=1 Tax=Lucilia cuprina TaxID=7375 RepID=UPI001F067B20|nr:uncharacterized protein LOC111674785 [Lucilia cuprina]
MHGTGSLIQYLVTTYYVHLTSILIVYDSSNIIFNELQQQYLDDVQQVFENQSRHGNTIGLQWINIANFNETDEDLNEQILGAVDLVAVEGFITILANTSRFLHARYYATRYTTLRLKDKIYLFLCESEENPKDFLANEVLQFYPHHLMVIPETIYPESNNNVDVTTTATSTTRITDSLSSFFNTNIDVTNNNNYNNYKYRGINFELWTQQYGGAEGNLNAIYLDTYISGNGTFAKNVQLYPNKLWNLQQRTMRIGSLTYVPYVKTYYVSPDQGNVDSIKSKGPKKTVQFIGVEAELMKSFCQIRNCHLRVKPYAADNWGIIYDNGSAEGMLGDLYKQNTEMAIGCIYNWYNDVTETSRFIARSAVTILGPGPAQFPRWRTNIMPFSYGLWLFLVFTMIMCSIMFHFIKYTSYRFKHIYSARQNKYRSIKNYEKTLLDIFAVFIQQPSADTVLHRVASRIFLAFLLCATITLENTYSGQLKSILTMPLFNEPVDTMHKWSLTGWKWAAPSIIWVHTVENSDLAMEQRLAKQFEVRDYEFLYNATFWDNYGFGVERIYSGSFSFGDYITGAALENKIVPKDDLYFDWTRAVAVRGWPLMPLLDRHISFCLETGIYIHWERHFSYKFLDHQVQDILKKLASGSKPKSPPQMLSIEHISGPLFILLFGYLLAFLVLMGELFGHRLKMKFLPGGRYLIKFK